MASPRDFMEVTKENSRPMQPWLKFTNKRRLDVDTNITVNHELFFYLV